MTLTLPPLDTLSTADLMVYLDGLAHSIAQRPDGPGLREYFIERYGLARLEYNVKIAFSKAKRITTINGDQ